MPFNAKLGCSVAYCPHYTSKSQIYSQDHLSLPVLLCSINLPMVMRNHYQQYRLVVEQPQNETGKLRQINLLIRFLYYLPMLTIYRQHSISLGFKLGTLLLLSQLATLNSKSGRYKFNLRQQLFPSAPPRA